MIIDRYLIREVAVPFLLGLLGLTALFLINQMVHLSDLLVGRGLSLVAVGRILGVLVPPFLLITLPAALLLAGIVAFSRLSAESELVALRAAGISFFRLMRPVALFAGLVAALALTVGLVAEPWGKGKLKHVAIQTLKAYAGVAITPGTFNDLFGNVIVYAEEATGSGRLGNIFIADERDPERALLVTAKSGHIVQVPGRDELGLHLSSGEIFRQGQVVQRVRFDTYDLKLTLKSDPTPQVYEWAELKAELARRQAHGEPVGRLLRLALDHTRNITFAVACFIFGLLGPALGIHRARSGRMGGFIQGVLLILAYYVLVNVAQALVMNQRIPIQAGAWIPNGVFAVVTLYVLVRAHGERPLAPAWWPLRRPR